MKMFFRSLQGKMAKIVETGVIGAVLVTFMPPAMAAFPQQDSIKANRLEKNIQDQVKNIVGVSDYDLEKVVLTFNKGL